ncbi:MAG: primosomal protein N' [Planctomycetaceae bacterium]
MSRSQQNLFEAAQLPENPEPWELAAEGDRVAAAVVFPRPLETIYHYLVPDSLRELLAPGQRVKAPFGRGDRGTIGFCVGVGPVPDTSRKLKEIAEVLDREPLLDERMLELTRWIAEHYLCGWGQVLDSVIPAGVKKGAGTRVVNYFELAPDARDRFDELDLPAKQRAVLAALVASRAPLDAEELTRAADCGTGPIAALRKRGLIRAVRKRTVAFTPDEAAIEIVPDLRLNPEQRLALDRILELMRGREHRTVLLHGVTGSGKTEIYIQAIREVVAYGRQAIVLVPEISLTPQTIRRFRARFDSVAVLHSHLTDAERHWHWQRIARGEVSVIVGARSAVFAPAPHLGLIVIDEEHETSFKQDNVPRYHAREVARKRAEMERVPLVLGSATPTLESWLRVERKEDVLVELPYRVERRPLPPVIVVDTRHDPSIARREALGRVLTSAMRAALADDGQIILFLNLRGYAPVLWCRTCESPVKCPHCDVSLVWHRDRQAVLCHSCEFEVSRPRECLKCGTPGLKFLGTGTQRLEQEVRLKFPDAACLRMDSDSMKQRGSHDKALEAFRRGEVRILLGTQMIAKGLDFPNVTLVGVVDADTILHQPDLRAAERTFQLISQVAGRTGRSARGGRVFVQTTSPGEPCIQLAAKHDFLRFAERELAHRLEGGAPPFVHLARVILRHREEPPLKEAARAMAETLRAVAKELELPVKVLGPAPAPVAKLKDQYRYHLQLSAVDLAAIQRLWRESARRLREITVEYVVDIDPVNMR